MKFALRTAATVGATVAVASTALVLNAPIASATTTSSTMHRQAVTSITEVHTPGGGSLEKDGILHLANGTQVYLHSSQYSSYKTQKAHWDATHDPDAPVTGDCGSSFINATTTAPGTAQIDTGFTVNLPALAYVWQVYFTDANGMSTLGYGGGLAAQSEWHNDPSFTFRGAGTLIALVDSSNSDAILIDGTVCQSLGPAAYAYL